MTYGFLPQCLYGTNTSPVGDIIYKKPYEDRRMQKKKNLYKKSKYYRQRQKKIRQICMAAGGVLLLVVLILIVRGWGMCRKGKECKLFECKQRNRRKDNWFCSFF